MSYENGVLKVKAAHSAQVDKDGDAKPSLKVSGQVEMELDAYEAVTEIAKKDLPFLESIIKAQKV